MRIPPNLKYFLLFLLVIAAITAGTIYLPKIFPNIGKIAIWIALGGMGILIIGTFVKPFLSFLYARTDGIFALYIDQSKKGFHVFGYHIGSGGETGPSVRDIQHYFILFNNGRVYYKCIFSHDMEPVAGRSGWSGFDSFEKSVLPSPALKKTMEKLSAKTGINLQLAERINLSNDHSARFETEDYAIHLKKFEQATDEGIKITCTGRSSNRLQWKRKI